MQMLRRMWRAHLVPPPRQLLLLRTTAAAPARLFYTATPASSTGPAGSSSSSSSSALILRPPTLDDTAAVHALVRVSGLDVNSPYAYMLGATHWQDTSITAHRLGLASSGSSSAPPSSGLVGMVHGYLIPGRADPAYFVWQVATDARAHRCGYASDMIVFLLRKHAYTAGVRFLEATVTPDNIASQRLFRGLAAKLGCPVEVQGAFFPANAEVEPPTKEEDLYRVGPFTKESLNAYLGGRGLLPPPPPPSSGAAESPSADRAACSLLVRDLADVEAAGNYKRGSRAKWESRRYLTRGDGFGFSFHHTVMYQGCPSFQWYKNHTESVYITQGYGTIEIVTADADGVEPTPENFERFVGTGVTYELSPGTMYALRGEKHILTARSPGGLHCQCVFNPPVSGTEDHNDAGFYPAVDDEGVQHYEYSADDVPRLFKPPEAYKGGSGWCR